MSTGNGTKSYAAQHDGFGWLGRAADASRQASSTIPDSIYVGNQSIPVALRGRRANAISLENDSDLELLASATPARQNEGNVQRMEVLSQIRRSDIAWSCNAPLSLDLDRPIIVATAKNGN
jgi:hypothetical protein